MNKVNVIKQNLEWEMIYCQVQKNVKRIIAPATDAFNCADQIVKICKDFDKQVLFIMALGPTAKVVAYELCKENYRVLDLGHLDIEYKWFIRNTIDKISIPGKFTNESIIKYNAAEDKILKITIT